MSELKSDYDYEQATRGMSLDELVQLASAGGLLASATVPQVADDAVAYVAENGDYNKYKAAKILNAIKPGPYKINLKYPEHRTGWEGEIARAWKGASPYIEQLGKVAKYYPTAKLLADDARFVMQTPQYKNFDRYMNGEIPIDDNTL